MVGTTIDIYGSYSYGPDHSKTGQFKMAASLDHFIYIYIKEKNIYKKWSRLSKSPVFEWSGPKPTFFNHLKTGHVRISDPHCT